MSGPTGILEHHNPYGGWCPVQMGVPMRPGSWRAKCVECGALVLRSAVSSPSEPTPEAQS